jgi:hypothetical protein
MLYPDSMIGIFVLVSHTITIFKKEKYSILTLNVNGLKSAINRPCLANWIKKGELTICCLQETHLIDKNKHWLRVNC